MLIYLIIGQILYLTEQTRIHLHVFNISRIDIYYIILFTLYYIYLYVYTYGIIIVFIFFCLQRPKQK